MTTIEEYAAIAIKRPDDFGYWGSNENMFVNWGITGPHQTRDSDVLERSNFEVIKVDLLEKFPDDIDVIGCSHWAVGWVDSIVCRVYDDDGNITDAFRTIIEWKEQLEEYPVANEEHYSEMEHEEFYRDLEDLLNLREDVKLGDVMSYAYNVCGASRFEDLSREDINEIERLFCVQEED